MMKPIPDEYAAEDQRIWQIVRSEQAYDRVDDVVREHASDEYAKWYFDMQKYFEELNAQGCI